MFFVLLSLLSRSGQPEGGRLARTEYSVAELSISNNVLRLKKSASGFIILQEFDRSLFHVSENADKAIDALL